MLNSHRDETAGRAIADEVALVRFVVAGAGKAVALVREIGFRRR
jgi:hypothetical protein